MMNVEIREPSSLDFQTVVATSVRAAIAEFYLDEIGVSPGPDSFMDVEARVEGEIMFKVYTVSMTIDIQATGEEVDSDGNKPGRPEVQP